MRAVKNDTSSSNRGINAPSAIRKFTSSIKWLDGLSDALSCVITCLFLPFITQDDLEKGCRVISK